MSDITDVAFDGFEALVADGMLHAAGILQRYRLADAQGDEHTGEHRVPLVDLPSDSCALFRQGDKAVFIHLDILAFFQKA